MKKLHAIAFVTSVLFLGFFAVGCGSTPAPETVDETVEDTAEEVEETDVSVETPTVPGALQGTWYDEKYDCNWTLNVSADDLTCSLRDAKSDALIYKFTKDNTQNFDLNAGVSGVSVEFDCAAKNRNYKFKKAASTSKDLEMDIYNSKYNTRHQATIEYKGYKAE